MSAAVSTQPTFTLGNPSHQPTAIPSLTQAAPAPTPATAAAKKENRKNLLPTVIPEIIIDDKGVSRYVTGKLLGEVNI
jgi:hypothetical protein